MLIEFLVVSGWLFWAILAGVIIVEIAALSTGVDETSFPIAVAVLTLIGAALFTDAFAGARPLWLAVGLVGYLLLGAVWSVKKWWTFVVETRDELWRQYQNSNYVNKTTAGNETWAAYSKSRRPVAADNRQRIVTWMGLWPFSFAWWCLTWPRRVFVYFYERLITLYDRISAHIWTRVS